MEFLTVLLYWCLNFYWVSQLYLLLHYMLPALPDWELPCLENFSMQAFFLLDLHFKFDVCSLPVLWSWMLVWICLSLVSFLCLVLSSSLSTIITCTTTFVASMTAWIITCLITSFSVAIWPYLSVFFATAFIYCSTLNQFWRDCLVLIAHFAENA